MFILKYKKYYWLLGIVVLGAFLSFPSVLWAEWFPMDIPVLFGKASNFKESLSWIVNPNTGSGRYVPIYWLYYCLNYLVFGTKIAGYYALMNVFYFVAVGFCVWLFNRSSSGTKAQCILLFLCLYLGSPVAEAINTIGKPEPLAAFFVLAWLSFLYKFGLSGVYKKILLCIGFILALWTKETSLVLFVFGGVKIFFVMLFKKKRNEIALPAIAKECIWAVLICVISVALSQIPKYIFPSLSSSSTYISYKINLELVLSNAYFYVCQQPDIIVCGLMAVFFLWIKYKNICICQNNCSDKEVRDFVFMAGVGGVAWSYIFGLLIWRWPMQYYLLLPSMLFKVCVFYGLFGINYRSICALRWRVGCIVLTVTTLYGAIVYFYVMQSQIAYSILYTKALNEYISNAHENEALVVESYPFYAEQIDGTIHLLPFLTQSKHVIKGIGDVVDPAVNASADILSMLSVTQEMLKNNFHNLPKKNDYLLVFTGKKIGHFFLRGVSPYYSEDSALKKQGVYDLKLVSEDEIHCTFPYINLWTGYPEIGDTSLGYKLYRVANDHPKFIWHDRYLDKWMGREASLSVPADFGSSLSLTISSPSFLLPNSVSIYKDGVFFRKLKITAPNELKVNLPNELGGVVYLFKSERIVSPKAIGLNNDTRKLGLRIELDDESRNQ